MGTRTRLQYSQAAGLIVHAWQVAKPGLFRVGEKVRQRYLRRHQHDQEYWNGPGLIAFSYFNIND
jgi:hypothetical protein